MQITHRLIASALTLTCTAVGFGACGSGSSAGEGPETAADSGVSSGVPPTTCLTAADVSGIIGLAVRDFPAGTQAYGESAVCAYLATDELGASVTTIVGPAGGGESDEVFASMRESVRLFLGPQAEPEPIQVGERGYAYGSSSKSEAAAIAGGRMYHAEFSSPAANVGDKKAGVVEIVRRLIEH